MNESINWYGWFTPFSGYGVVNLEYATILNKLTNNNLTIGWERFTKETNKDEWEALTDDQKNLFKKDFEQSRIGIIKTTPGYFKQNKSTFRIGYSMVENTVIGKPWVDQCNEMDMIFCPSQFVADVFLDSGVTVPIKVVKQGIDPLKYPYIQRMEKDNFVFATCGWLDERKNWDMLAQAFASEFYDYEPVELWLKNTNPNFGNHSFTDPRIKIINTRYTFDEMKKFYALTDCFVFPSQGEGSGMPPREAMATGLPVILTNWSGLAEVCDPKYNFPLTPIAIDVQDHRGIEQPGMRARIDVQELMYYMRYVYEHQDEARMKGMSASKLMHKEWSWEACGNHMLSILNTI